MGAMLRFTGSPVDRVHDSSAVNNATPAYTRGMRSCPLCGEANPDRAQFCLACGAALGATPERETRRAVTVLFSDLVGSTELGDRLDPESIRRIMSEYFDAMRAVLESHGGTVEKFIGDAIVAVFGIPNIHEDDALRALRAAHAMRERLRTLNASLERDWGVRLQVRTGVNTGEVIAGDPLRGQAFVSGDAVNVAARLEQAAAPDEILIGERTFVLGDEAIQTEPLSSLSVKGKGEPIAAWRLLNISQGLEAKGRRTNTPFLGRGDELTELTRVFERASQEGICVVATVVGPPGIGKSRLADEFTAAVGDRARVVTGHCLSYGEGITYWPLAEIVNALDGASLDTAVAEAVREDAAVVAGRIAAAIGIGEVAASPAEIFWAFRKLFEGLARQRPLIVVIDDVHWAEPTLLDLLEYVIGFASGVPLVLLCLARADLFDARPSWAIPRQNAVIVPLQPIAHGDADALVQHIAGGEITPAMRVRVTEAAEGNPLFIEHLLALNIESSSNGEIIVVPATLQALLAARIDRLSEAERAVIERAAIEGRGFHRGAVVELTPDHARAGVAASLISLSRKEFIHADQSLFAGDDGFRFDHILIRDAAYEAVPKQLRADLHERFALWLERIVADRVAEYEEILGYHLELAHRYHAELGRAGEARRLADSAAERLASAGLRALARGDMPAAIQLLLRAVTLLPVDDERRLELLPELANALIEAGRLAEAEQLLAEAEERARAAGSEVALWRSMIAGLSLMMWTGTVASDAVLTQIEAAIAACARLGDDLGSARAWHLLATFRMWGPARSDTADEAFLHALSHAGRAAARREEAVTRQWMLINTWFGATRASEGIRRCHEALQQTNAAAVEATARIELGCFLAMRGQFDEAHASYAGGLGLFEDLGQQLNAAGNSQEFYDIAMLAGDPAAAERRLRSACDVLERMGNNGFLATRLGCLADAIYAQGRFAEAEAISERAEELVGADPSDRDAQFRWRAVRAKVLARRGDHVAAELMAREALALVESTDWLNAKAGVHLDMAEVLQLSGRLEEAGIALQAALRLFEAKENDVAARRTRARIDELANRPALGGSFS
jgi:class 3 adenylate cyclase/tetratricopeptide (TPR) repeat protein